jgi:hypothetical protein
VPRRCQTRNLANFYLAVVQAVLLYGADTCVVSQRAIKRLRNFHPRCARYITRRHIWKDENDEWIALLLRRFWKRKNTLQHYATSRAIYRECERSRPLAIPTAQLVWWTSQPICRAGAKILDPPREALRLTLTGLRSPASAGNSLSTTTTCTGTGM